MAGLSYAELPVERQPIASRVASRVRRPTPRHVEVPELAGPLDPEDAGPAPARLDGAPLDHFCSRITVAVSRVAPRGLDDRDVDLIGDRLPLR